MPGMKKPSLWLPAIHSALIQVSSFGSSKLVWVWEKWPAPVAR